MTDELQEPAAATPPAPSGTVYILAATYREACEVAMRRGLPRTDGREWVYVSRPDRLRGVRDRLLLVERDWQRGRSPSILDAYFDALRVARRADSMTIEDVDLESDEIRAARRERQRLRDAGADL